MMIFKSPRKSEVMRFLISKCSWSFHSFIWVFLELLCIYSLRMPHYVDNMIPGIPHFVCEDQPFVNTVMTNCSTKGISSFHVSKPSCKSWSCCLWVALVFSDHGSSKWIAQLLFNKTLPTKKPFASFPHWWFSEVWSIASCFNCCNGIKWDIIVKCFPLSRRMKSTLKEERNTSIQN